MVLRKLNQLFLLLRKKKRMIVAIILLLLVLLAGGIRIVEYYNKEFLIKHILINEFINQTSVDYFLDYDCVLELVPKAFFFIAFIALEVCLFPLIIWDFHKSQINSIQIEEEKIFFLKKHMVYHLHGCGFFLSSDDFYSLTVAINIDNFKKIWLYGLSTYGGKLLPIQKAIKNFNEMVITEKININSYEECLEFIKIFVKLISRNDEELILKEEDEFTTELFSFTKPGQPPRKIKYTVKAPFIFKKPGYPYDEGREQEDYYVELHMGFPESRTVGEKWTFKVKKNGEIYDFNKIIFSEDSPVV